MLGNQVCASHGAHKINGFRPVTLPPEHIGGNRVDPGEGNNWVFPFTVAGISVTRG